MSPPRVTVKEMILFRWKYCAPLRDTIDTIRGFLMPMCVPGELFFQASADTVQYSISLGVRWCLRGTFQDLLLHFQHLKFSIDSLWDLYKVNFESVPFQKPLTLFRSSCVTTQPLTRIALLCAHVLMSLMINWKCDLVLFTRVDWTPFYLGATVVLTCTYSSGPSSATECVLLTTATTPVCCQAWYSVLIVPHTHTVPVAVSFYVWLYVGVCVPMCLCVHICILLALWLSVLDGCSWPCRIMADRKDSTVCGRIVLVWNADTFWLTKGHIIWEDCLGLKC